MPQLPSIFSAASPAGEVIRSVGESRGDSALLRRRRGGARAPEPDLRGEAAPARRAARARARTRACSTSRPAAAGPALLLAREFGCTVHGIEIAPEFHAVARRAGGGGRRRATASRSSSATQRTRRSSPSRTTRRSASARASSSAALPTRSTRSRRPFARAGTWRSASRSGAGFRFPRTTRIATIRGRRSRARSSIFETSGLPVVSVIASSEDDWDRYETLHWRPSSSWLAANPDDPDAPEIRARHERAKRTYLRHGRDLARLGDLRRLEAALGTRAAGAARTGGSRRGAGTRARAACRAGRVARNSFSSARTVTSRRLAVLDARDRELLAAGQAERLAASRPAGTGAGGSPIISRFERWIRS